MTASIGAERWDALMEGCGTSSVESLAMGERVFRDIDAKRNASVYLHAGPVLIEKV